MTKPVPRLHLRDMFTEPSGRLSHTRVWSNIGSAAATAVFLKMAWAGTLTGDVFAYYLAGVCSHAALSKYLTAKASQSTPAYGTSYDYRSPAVPVEPSYTGKAE